MLNIIVGLGDTGLSCARYLRSKKLPFIVMDDRENPPQLKPFLQEFSASLCHLGEFSLKLLDQATEIIISPGVSLKEPAIAQLVGKKSIIGDIELFARDIKKFKKPIVGITGSNGKTTVTTLVGEMCKAAGKKVAVCGNIGTPVLDMLFQPVADYYVMELSSFQLETTYSLQLAAATLLNISPDHLDRYSNMQEYTSAKQRIFQHCAIPVVNFDEPQTWQDLSFSQQPLQFSLSDNTLCDFYVRTRNLSAQQYLIYRDTPLIAISELKLRTRHHVQNALAALALGSAIDLPMQTMLDVLRNFTGLPHRCQWVRNYQGVDYYNDSKGTNIGATEAALISLGGTNPGSGKIILIAGGQSKGADFSSLKSSLARFVNHLILIGEDAPKLEKAFHAVVPIVRAQSMQDAVTVAAEYAKPGDIVLLSPACASFDMFNNYKHRGEMFVKAVAGL